MTRKRTLKGMAASMRPFIDVAMGSASSMLLAFAAAQSLDVHWFGVFGILTLVAALALSVVQGGFIDLLLMKPKGTAGRTFLSLERWSLLAMLAVGAPLVTHFVTDRATSAALALSAAGSVWLSLRYNWARAFYTVEQRNARSLVASASLLTASACLLIAAATEAVYGPSQFLVAYGASYAIASLVGMLPGGITSGRTSEGATGTLWSWSFAIETFILVGGIHLASLAVVPVLGLEFSAGVRGASLLLGPLSLVIGALRLVLLPRFAGMGPIRGQRLAIRSCLAVSFASLVWCGAAWFFVDEFGGWALGDSAGVTATILPWASAGAVLQGLYLILFLAGRAWSLDRDVRVARTVYVTGALLAAGVTLSFPDLRLFYSISLLGQVLALLWLGRGVTRSRAPVSC